MKKASNLLPFSKRVAWIARLLRRAVPAGALVLLPAMGADSARVGSYDFNYMVAGDFRARPVQVFDDGRSTFFQFRPGEAFPAIFSHQSGTPQLLVPVQEGPYIRVAEVHGRFVLQAGRAQANVVHAGSSRPDAPAVNVVGANGMSATYQGVVPDGARVVASLSPVGLGSTIDDAAHRNSYATPRKGDAVRWVEAEPKHEEVSVLFARGSAVLTPEARKVVASAARASTSNTRFVVTGRDDDSLKEGVEKLRAAALVAALVNAGVDASRVTSRTGVAGAARGQSWPSTIQIETDRPMATVPAETTRAAAIRSNLDALVAAGVLKPDQALAIAAHHSGRPAPQVQPDPPRGFSLAAADKTIQGTLRRWASAHNYQLVWDAPAEMDAAVMGDLPIPGDTLAQAMENLLAGLKAMGYELSATVYSNRVVRLTAAAAPAPRATADAARPAASPPHSPAPAAAPSAVVPAAAPVAAPVPQTAPRTEPKPPAMLNLADTAQPWRVLERDQTVQNMLSRWASEAQWQVVWNAKERIQITGDAQMPRQTFQSAAQEVIKQAAAVGYRVRLTNKDDRTIVVSSY